MGQKIDYSNPIDRLKRLCELANRAKADPTVSVTDFIKREYDYFIAQIPAGELYPGMARIKKGLEDASKGVNRGNEKHFIAALEEIERALPLMEANAKAGNYRIQPEAYLRSDDKWAAVDAIANNLQRNVRPDSLIFKPGSKYPQAPLDDKKLKDAAIMDLTEGALFFAFLDQARTGKKLHLSSKTPVPITADVAEQARTAANGSSYNPNTPQPANLPGQKLAGTGVTSPTP